MISLKFPQEAMLESWNECLTMHGRGRSEETCGQRIYCPRGEDTGIRVALSAPGELLTWTFRVTWSRSGDEGFLTVS